MGEQATKFKLPKAQAQTANDLESTETKPQKLTRDFYAGYKYKQRTNINIAFEYEKYVKGIKIMNKDGVTFTAVVNDALDLMLYLKGQLKEQDLKPELISLLNKFNKKRRPANDDKKFNH